MKKLFLLFNIIILLTRVSFAESPFVKVVQQDNRQLVLEFSFPTPELQTAEVNGVKAAVVNIKGLDYSYEEGKPYLPIFSTEFVAPEGKLQWQMMVQEKKDFPGVTSVLYYADDQDVKHPQATVWRNVFPEKVVDLVDLGIFRDYRMMGVRVYPVQVTPQGLRFYQKFRIKINFPRQNKFASPGLASEEKLFKKFAINGSRYAAVQPAIAAGSQVSVPNSLQSRPLGQVKMFVSKEGIYRITGQDLLDARINIQTINPQTFRLMNRGKEVPVYISGEQDLTFGPSDYIEFWGEPNEKTLIDQYPDVYKDPFSDENVYWLEWGGVPGVRMVEESGAITVTNPTQYNPAIFYRYTVHLEKNAYFERLGYGNVHNLSYTRDLWFYDSGIQAIGKRNYPVELIYPDSSSFNPVDVELKLCGKSQSSHNVMAWLNQRFVGQSTGTWFSQDTFTLKNFGNSSIRSSDLVHGTNSLEIQLPTLSTNGQSDYILFNWANITYDRQYKAYQNYIEFSKPSPSVIYFPNNDLFQFHITNFTRPDIEIYKKGVSKIVNYNLVADGQGNNVRYAITFQDHILTDNVDYIALTPDQKLKPDWIEAEEPYNPDQPELTLKDPSNSADYLIITHHKFYDQAKELAEYRRQQGLHVVLVNVRDIYDEFNYGIKSPLAIRKFLKYAFYNWDRTHRLKYVLFLGDANFDYKRVNVVNEDYVPTFFFQTYKFGAVASDFPYSLIAGNDYLPDIFIGRIPAATKGDVTTAIEKIKEYEQNPAPGDWKNQAVFVSGNDKSTFELSSQILSFYGLKPKPAFRTQNQRVIDMLLPRHYSVHKLNTVKDDSLAYDPNFGGTTDLIDYFDNGCGFLTFLGHGGGAIWADVKLLNIQDVNRLNNKGMYPFVASMTCFTGAFDNPGNPGLAQQLLLSRDKGAIAVFASSGLGWVANDYSMLWNLMKHLYTGGNTLGEAVQQGKIDYFISSQYVINDTIVPGSFWGHGFIKYDMIHQYNLIGDPYLTLRTPDKELAVQVDNNLPNPGDTINVSIQSDMSSAEGYLELANRKDDIVYREPLFYTGGTSYRIKVPDDFPDGSGFVRAFLDDGVTSAAGFTQIASNYAVFDSVTTLPLHPNAEDSVQVELVAKHQAGISRVDVVAMVPRANGTLDTVRLKTVPVSENRFRTRKKIPPTRSLATVYYIVYATNTQGQLSRMSYLYEVTDQRPDPFVYPGKIRWVGGSQVKVGVSVGNSGTYPAQNLKLAVYQGKQAFRENQYFASKTISLDGKDSTTISFNFPFPMNVPSYQLYVRLDPEGGTPDFNPDNNLDSTLLPVDMYNLIPNLGSTYDNLTNDTLTIGAGHQFWVPPGAVSRPSAVKILLTEIPETRSQKGIAPLLLKGHQVPRMANVNVFNQEAVFNQPYLLSLRLDEEDVNAHKNSLENLRLYRWDPRFKAWIQEQANLSSDSTRLIAFTTQPGAYAPFITSDNEPPKIELTIDGRPLRSKSQVSSEPKMNLIVQDESGLNLGQNQIHLLIDDVPVPAENVFIPDSVQQSQILGISVYPHLELGQHTFTVMAKDVNGNSIRQDFTLLVSDKFDVHVFGNYPNPFSDFTVFSYFVSPDVLDEFEIRIYTVSGRLIKKIQNDANTINQPFGARSSGYNELMWDGTDEDGNEVANGVYFALIRAKYKDQMKEEILKVAKLK